MKIMKWYFNDNTNNNPKLIINNNNNNYNNNNNKSFLIKNSRDYFYSQLLRPNLRDLMVIIW